MEIGIVIPDGCREIRSDSIISCRQHQQPQRRMQFTNIGRIVVHVVCVDDCVPLSGQRCDKLVRVPNRQSNFVELKGRNVEEAVAQLANSIRQLKVGFGQEVLRAFVICNESPSVTQAQRMKERFKRATNAELVIRTRYYEAPVVGV